MRCAILFALFFALAGRGKTDTSLHAEGRLTKVDPVVLALNIVMGGSLGNVSATQFLQIPDAQLNADVRTSMIASFRFVHMTHNSVSRSADLPHRPFR